MNRQIPDLFIQLIMKDALLDDDKPCPHGAIE